MIEPGGADERRERLLAHVLRLEYVTVGWNLVEGFVAIAAGVGAGSIALVGFGVDSFVELAAGLVLIWRVAAERSARDGEEIERAEHRARRLVGASLWLLAAYVTIEAVHKLWSHERPEASAVGVGLLIVSLVVMGALARAKRAAAVAWGSRALAADATQTSACWWLSLIALGGTGLNAAAGWWWADPVAALGMAVFLVREGRDAWRGEACGCSV